MTIVGSYRVIYTVLDAQNVCGWLIKCLVYLNGSHLHMFHSVCRVRWCFNWEVFALERNLLAKFCSWKNSDLSALCSSCHFHCLQCTKYSACKEIQFL